MKDEMFRCFGDRGSLALEARLIADPEPHSACAEDAWSYGELRMFVRGRCLTRHAAPEGFRDEVRWYLAPLLRWLDEAWIALLHEQRFPFPIGSQDHMIVAFENAERRLLEEESGEASARRATMQAWRKRHSFWTGAGGGILPNVWLRRQSDFCEIAYDPGPPVGAPHGFEFQFSRGTVSLDALLVASCLEEFAEWGAEHKRGRRESMTGWEAREAESWMIGPHLADVLAQADVPLPKFSHGMLYPSSPEVAMFGTLTPDLAETDARILLAALEQAKSDEPEPARLSSLVANRSPPTRETSWGQGYDDALRVLDALSINDLVFVDVEDLLGQLAIAVESRSISDHSLRGIAIAGEGFKPTIILNEGCNRNATRPGRRFTLAHEFCHILFDRGQARRVTHSSSPWAPEPIERRANAFAAMLLMPYRLVDAIIAATGQIRTVRDLTSVARRLGCGKQAVLEHLRNIDRISATAYHQLRAST